MPWTLDERARTPSTAWAFYAANVETWLTKSFFSTICNFLSPGWIKRPSAVVVDMRDAKPRPGSLTKETENASFKTWPPDRCGGVTCRCCSRFGPASGWWWTWRHDRRAWRFVGRIAWRHWDCGREGWRRGRKRFRRGPGRRQW